MPGGGQVPGERSHDVGKPARLRKRGDLGRDEADAQGGHGADSSSRILGGTRASTAAWARLAPSGVARAGG